MKKDPPSLEQRIENPCIQLCVKDRTEDICLGCGRTQAEIDHWAMMTKAQRQEIVHLTDERLAGLTHKRRQNRQGRNKRQVPPKVTPPS